MAQELISLAMNPSSDARSELMQKLADIFLLRAEQNSVEELLLFDEVIQRLLDSSPLDERVRFAEKIAPFAGTPAGLAVRLAQDEVQVARPVLEHSPALGPQELAALAEYLGEDHLEWMTHRADLPVAVSDTLVRRGQMRVRRRLAGNRRIRLSEEALATLARAAQEDSFLREEMTLRSDLTPRICRTLMPFVDAVTQERLKELAAGRLTAEDLEGIARRRKIRRKLGTLLDTSNTSQLWRAITLGSAALDDVLLLMLEDDRLTNAADLMALACNTHKAHVRSAVFSIEGKGCSTLPASPGSRSRALPNWSGRAANTCTSRPNMPTP
ncbi:DUF2336 domain-containing protein [Pannonibacter phragmitetus]|uniref:DUF2336 domain-containing protein n=1 Tax=Pannonibacter phragmitetus TaxID=121719 RepID=UPI003D2F4917